MRVTYLFHPLSGRDFEFVAHRQNWGEDRVHLHDEDGELFSLWGTRIVPQALTWAFRQLAHIR